MIAGKLENNRTFDTLSYFTSHINLGHLNEVSWKQYVSATTYGLIPKCVIHKLYSYVLKMLVITGSIIP